MREANVFFALFTDSYVLVESDFRWRLLRMWEFGWSWWLYCRFWEDAHRFFILVVHIFDLDEVRLLLMSLDLLCLFLNILKFGSSLGSSLLFDINTIIVATFIIWIRKWIIWSIRFYHWMVLRSHSYLHFVWQILKLHFNLFLECLSLVVSIRSFENQWLNLFL